MSVDSRLRDAFGEETREVETGAALREVHERARRARVWQGGAAAGVAAAALLAGIGSVVAQDHGRSDQPVGRPGVSQSTESPVPVRPTGPSAIDGTWTLGPVTAARIRSTLREAGQEAWIPTVARDFPKPPLRYRLTVGQGRVDLVVTGADGARVPMDQEYLTLTGHEAVGIAAVSRYGWGLVDGSLRLTYRSTSEGHEDSTPYAAFQRALYTVGDWTRVGRG
jgi:hypothetical protein